MPQVGWRATVLAATLAVAGCAGSSEPLIASEEAPEFALQDTEGNTVALADYREVQPVLLYFHMAVG